MRQIKGRPKMNDILIHHPAVGSVWLSNCHIEGDYVVGDAWDDSDVGSSYLPDDYQGEPVTMNFPISCICKDPDGLMRHKEAKQ